MDRFNVRLAPDRAARLPADYLSLTMDTSLVLGGHWWGPARGTRKGLALERIEPIDLRSPSLAAYARLLAPAMLRIGGTEADSVGYLLGKKGHQAPSGGSVAARDRELLLKKKLWKRINAFAKGAGFEILFVVGAGPLDRDGSGAWIAAGARKLIEHTARKGYPVRAWELGNEVNGYPFTQGLRNRVSAKRYIEDFGAFSRLVRELDPGSLAVGPASSVWPAIGEPNPIIPALGRSRSMAMADVVSWHYYPQQSSRGELANRRASETMLLSPRRLDSVRKLSASISKAARGRQVWMTESGHALYGGEKGLSDTHLSSLWWLDELGLLAREGVSRVFRQSFVGADYGLLDQSSFEPRPDYFASFLWKKLMGRVVYAAPEVAGAGRAAKAEKRIRAYCHSSAKKPRSACLLLVSLRDSPSRISLPAPIVERYVVSPRDGLRSARLRLNGVDLGEDLLFKWGKKKIRRKYRISEPAPEDREAAGASADFELPPYSYAFLLLSQAARPGKES
jgi:heparanase